MYVYLFLFKKLYKKILKTDSRKNIIISSCWSWSKAYFLRKKCFIFLGFSFAVSVAGDGDEEKVVETQTSYFLLLFFSRSSFLYLYPFLFFIMRHIHSHTGRQWIKLGKKFKRKKYIIRFFLILLFIYFITTLPSLQQKEKFYFYFPNKPKSGKEDLTENNNFISDFFLWSSFIIFIQ